MSKYILIFLIFVVFPVSGYSYEDESNNSSFQYNIDSLNELLLEVEEKRNGLPKGMYELFEQMEWQSKKYESVNVSQKILKESFKGNSYLSHYKIFNENISEFHNSMYVLNEENEKNIERVVIVSDALREVMDYYSINIFPGFLSFHRALNDSVTEISGKNDLDKDKLDKVNSSVKLYFDDLLNSLETIINDKLNKNKKLLSKHEETLERLSKYKSILKNKIQEFEKSAELSSKLYIIILTIGGLGIATIAVIRVFPESIVKEWVASGQVIQFVTVMILLSAILALGVAGLLGQETLGLTFRTFLCIIFMNF